MKSERARDAPGDRALAGSRRPVDRDNGRPHAAGAAGVAGSAMSHDRGERVEVRRGTSCGRSPGSLIVTPVPPSAASAKHIAIRWSSYVSIVALRNAASGATSSQSLPASSVAPSLRELGCHRRDAIRFLDAPAADVREACRRLSRTAPTIASVIAASGIVDAVDRAAGERPSAPRLDPVGARSGYRRPAARARRRTRHRPGSSRVPRQSRARARRR